MDDLPESIDLETVRRDKPVEYAGRVQKLGFREGLLVAGGLIVILTGAGVVAIGPHPAASPSLPAVAPTQSPALTLPSGSFGPSPTPGRTPAATPSGSCTARAPSSPPPVLLLSHGAQVPGAMVSDAWQRTRADFSEQEGSDAVIPLGEPVILSIDFNACALAWRIAFGNTVVQDQANPTMDPSYALQGYFTVKPPAVLQSGTVLQLDLRFPGGWTTSRWLLTPMPAAIPDAFIIVGEGATLADPGCGFTVQLQDGVAGTESCEGWDPGQLYLNTVYVEPRTQLTFRIPQAVFSPASTEPVGCGHISGTPLAFSIDPTCDVGFGLSPADDVTFQAPAERGVWTVAVDGCAMQSGGSACGIWYVTIDTQDPQPTDAGVVD